MDKSRSLQSRGGEDEPALTPAMFGILLAVATVDRHGLGIIEEIEHRTEGETTLAIGTLYRSIARLSEEGLIAPARRRPVGAEDDSRRIYYRITERGRRAMLREAQRLDRLVKWARHTRTEPRIA
jgi:DNA-binding PadR family transcriptional regulator